MGSLFAGAKPWICTIPCSDGDSLQIAALHSSGAQKISLGLYQFFFSLRMWSHSVLHLCMLCLAYGSCVGLTESREEEFQTIFGALH